MKYYYFLLLVSLITACQQSNTKDKPLSKHNIKTQRSSKVELQKKAPAIDFPCAIVINPSDKAVTHLKKTNSEEDYNTIVDDNMYYMSDAEKFLDSVKIRKIERYSQGAIFFNTASGERYEVKLDTLTWAVLLFNGKNKPENVDMTNIQDEYKIYMQQ